MGIKKIKSRHYKYPSLKERVRIKDKTLFFRRFEFHYDFLESFLKGESLLEMKQKQFLVNWQSVFSNKLFWLSETLTFIYTHFNRGFEDELNNNNRRELVDLILFNYHTEIYFYYFFSTLDVLAQIINEFFSLKKDENQVKFNLTLINNISHKAVKHTLFNFHSSIKEARELRNSFTHRFPKNHVDYRIKLDEEKKTLYGVTGKFMKSNEFINIISNSSRSLNDLLFILTQQMK